MSKKIEEIAERIQKESYEKLIAVLDEQEADELTRKYMIAKHIADQYTIGKFFTKVLEELNNE